jgi:hypothetical protein
VERIREQVNRVGARKMPHPAFQVADAAHAEVRSLGQCFLRQAHLAAVVLQHRRKRRHLLLFHHMSP